MGCKTYWSKANDFQVVITPCGRVMVEGETEQVWLEREVLASVPRAYESHFAMQVPRSAAEILELALKAGWRARLCRRGGLFEVVEVWVENAYLVEVLDPLQIAEYRQSMTVENWKRAFGAS